MFDTPIGFSPDAVANYFLERGKESRRPITPMKLQKLMYFAHGWHLALAADPLVSQQAQAWDYGPVFPDTYHEFKDLGNRPIDRLASETIMREEQLQIIHPSIAHHQHSSSVKSFVFSKAVMDRVWDVYSPYSAVKLSEMTHEEGSPWWEVRKTAERTYKGTIPKGLNIPNRLIQKWFAERFRTQEE